MNGSFDPSSKLKDISNQDQLLQQSQTTFNVHCLDLDLGSVNGSFDPSSKLKDISNQNQLLQQSQQPSMVVSTLLLR